VRCSSSLELPGLSARLDRLEHHHGGACLPPDRPHAFVYYITIRNASDRTVTLLGRKWVIDYRDGTQQVIEGDKIVGETPRLSPGEEFSYNSHHVTGCNAKVCGGFHGVDEAGTKIHVLLAPFDLTIPTHDAC
jgi:ApaG protein